jgi:hypothetical protein
MNQFERLPLTETVMIVTMVIVAICIAILFNPRDEQSQHCTNTRAENL